MIQIKSRIDFNHYSFFIASMCLARVTHLVYIYKGPTENSKNKNKRKKTNTYQALNVSLKYTNPIRKHARPIKILAHLNLKIQSTTLKPNSLSPTQI